MVVPLRRVLKRCHVLTARVTKIEHAKKSSRSRRPTATSSSSATTCWSSRSARSPGSLPIPGLAEHGIAFKTIGEAIYLRNHVMTKLDQAASTLDPELRKRLLTFTVVGGGFAGIEALAELEDMARFAVENYYENIEPADIRWVLVEAAGRILPEVRETLGVYTVEQLEKRGIEVYLSTAAKSFENGHVVLSDGTEFDTDTHHLDRRREGQPGAGQLGPAARQARPPEATAAMQVVGHPDVWTAGDNAAMPDLSRTEEDPTATCPPNAQHAVRQATLLAKNIIKVIRGGKPKDYYHKNLGAVASLGLHKGVADALNLKIKGFPAWLFHRAYHLKAMPTWNRKIRILFDWILGGLFRREVVSLGQINNPKDEFARVSKS